MNPKDIVVITIHFFVHTGLFCFFIVKIVRYKN
jgi:hypothetical protein